MKNPEDIMADYLLKGAKMLDKACPECGSPLFSVKGDTFCVVCREKALNKSPAPMTEPAADVRGDTGVHAASVKRQTDCRCITDDILYNEIRNAVSSLCRRIETESHPEDCLLIMNSVNAGIDALRKLEEHL
ncbi:MAG: Sjogren's syndrome/scleroderma autoantigen 1 family protein [Methanomicrobium sp.]|nr:Sjogren's syndrome/scleroderma autoantigen 1 family protein [Methanomicrobium sp.]